MGMARPVLKGNALVFFFHRVVLRRGRSGLVSLCDRTC
jgi:hypothetical protein